MDIFSYFSMKIFVEVLIGEVAGLISQLLSMTIKRWSRSLQFVYMLKEFFLQILLMH